MALEITTVASLLLALAVLAKASEYAIVYASAIARLAGVSELAIGFLLVAVSTSLPELVVSITSALSGTAQLGIGNVFGANIADVTIVLAAAAITTGVTIPRKEHSQLARILLAVSTLSLVMILGKLSAVLGIVLLAVFCAYVYFVLKTPVKFSGKNEEQTKAKEKVSVHSALKKMGSSTWELGKSLALFSVSMLAIILSSRFAVDTAVNFATGAGVGLALVGSTLVSIGTTLPELSVSIAAARAKKGKLALGNAIGSCITNITLILGAVLVLSPSSADLTPHLGLITYSVFTYLALLFFMDYTKKFGKLEGLALIAIYVLFLLAQANIITI